MIGILLLAAAFLCGSIPFGLLIGRMRGVDIRQHGSGNIGATNVWRILGGTWGTIAFLLDVAKGALVPALTPLIVATPELGIDPRNWQVLAGIVAVAGHMFSPFIGFKGGKGIAAGLGALLGSAPLVGICGFTVFIAVMFMCQWVSLSSLVAAIAVVAFGFYFRQTPFFIGVWTLVGLVVFYKHIPNIKRLAAGTEPKFTFSRAKSVQEPEAPPEGGSGEAGSQP